MNDTNRIWVLMGKELSRSISKEEQQELFKLLEEDPELWYAYELVQGVNSIDDVTEEYIQEIRSLLDKREEPVAPELTVAARKPRYSRILQVAAAFTGVAALAWAGWALLKPAGGHQHKEVAMSEIVAPKGSRTQITLTDGTAIWLNAGSRLTYPKNFSLENREVYLSGEAYFKVTHNDQHPFVVHTAETDITDLGTTFNVRAYTGSATTEATLIEGSIEVSLKREPARNIKMSPGEKLVLHNGSAARQERAAPQETKVFEVTAIVPDAKTKDIVETAWIQNKLIFRNERFEELAVMMERRYNITISITDEAVKSYQLTGVFKNENVKEALELLQAIVPFEFRIQNDHVYISK